MPLCSRGLSLLSMANTSASVATATPPTVSLLEHVAQRAWSSLEVAAAARFAATRMAAYEGSHGFDHALRVHDIAVRLASELTEQSATVDITVVELAGSYPNSRCAATAAANTNTAANL